MSLLEHLTIGSTRDVVILVLLSLTSCSVRGQTQQVNCELPGIDFESQRIDVLGDFEKTQICKLPRPESLCPRVGPADFACRAIARAVGGVRNVSCAYPNTCAFQVKVPVQHPSRPGFAFVSLCTPKFAGVIFPCRENSLVIANPFFKGAYVNDDPPPDVDPGEDAEDEGGRTVGQGNIASNPHCEFPPLDEDARAVDVLGDREKANICSLPRPLQLCNRGKGDADEFCRKIARSVGGTSDAKCLRRNICSFNVKKPVQRPDDPGLAYVSLCVPDGAGVIFPCRVNNLVVIDPYFDDIIDTEGGPKEPPPNWTPSPAKPNAVEPLVHNKGHALFGKYISYKLSNMDPTQARIAERLIAEILFEAETGLLNRNTQVVQITAPQPLPLLPDVIDEEKLATTPSPYTSLNSKSKPNPNVGDLRFTPLKN